MSKIIIPKSELPKLSQEGINKFRYRVINKNKNLTSQWSVIGNIKRPEEEVQYDQLPSSFDVSAGNNYLIAAWETLPDSSEQYEVYLKQYASKFDFFSGNTYYYGDQMFLSQTTGQSQAFVYGNFSARVGINLPTPRGGQVMVRNYRYPQTEYQSWEVSQVEVVSSYLYVYIQSGVTDFDFSNNQNNTFDVDLNVRDIDNPFKSLAEMKNYMAITTFTEVDKSNPSYTILKKPFIQPDLTFSNASGTVTRISPDPLFISDYVNW